MNRNLLKDKTFLLVAGIILIGIIVRIFVFGAVTTGHSQDSYWFITIGENFKNNFRIELAENQPYDLSQPLHPILLGITSIIFNELYFNGKLFSLIFGILILPMTYLFWKKVENKETAILALFFTSFGALMLKYSVAIREDSLYVFLLMITLFFIYKIKDDKKFLPIASIFIMLSSLTRWEGYLLIPVALFSFMYWHRKEIFEKNAFNLGVFLDKRFVLAFIIIFIPLFWWSFRSYGLCDCGVTGFIPSYSYQQQLSGGSGGAGLSYLTGIPEFIPWFFLIFVIGGLFFSLKEYRRYFPIFLYFVFTLFIHMNFRGKSEQITYVYPLLAGFMSIFILKFKNLFSKKNMKIFYALLGIFLIFFAVVEVNAGYNETKTWGTRNDVIKDAMDWANENIPDGETILVGDTIVYSYFTEHNLVGVSYATSWMNSYIQQNPGLKDPISSYVAFMIANNVNYAVAYDSTMPWFYGLTENLAKNREERIYNFEGGTVRIFPVQSFEKNGEEIVLYKIEFGE